MPSASGSLKGTVPTLLSHFLFDLWEGLCHIVPFTWWGTCWQEAGCSRAKDQHKGRCAPEIWFYTDRSRVMPRLLAWQLYQWGGNCHLPWYRPLSGVGVNLTSSRSSVGPHLLSHLLWSGATRTLTQTPPSVHVQLITISAFECVTPPTHTHTHTHTHTRSCPLEITRLAAVIRRSWRRLWFSDVIYLVLCWQPVMMMTCHSSLFCALYLYKVWSGFFFHCISLNLSPIFFVPYLQLMKKIKEKEYFTRVSNTFSAVRYQSPAW